MGTDKVQVAVRVRPFNRREIELGTKCVVEMNEGQTVLYHPSIEKGDSRRQPKTFAFDHCFWSLSEKDPQYAGQAEVYNDLGQDILQNAFQGYNACIFAYGQTGSGKSYTMMGSHENIGIIPRLCDVLFERIAKIEDASLNFKVEVSYMEIYNEKVHDLLDPKGHKHTLRVREHNILGPYVDGLSTLAVSSYQDINNLMQEGNKSRTVAATNMNSESSRSHAVFNIILTQTLVDERSGVSGEKVAKVSLVDLAGSERAVKTGAVGERLKEGSNINKSLTTLGLVISKLADQASAKPKDKFVPYRDSVLTWLLKDNLGGNSKTVMVATVSPASDNYEETLSTLRYADRAKRIINHAVVNEDPNARIIRELRTEVEALKERLQYATQGEGIREKLLESEKLMHEASRTWEEKLLRTELIHQERQQTLEKMGISVEASGIKVEQNKYYLVNLNADPSLNELLVYYLKERTLVGCPDAGVENDIQLSGLGIMPEHCVITMDGSELFVEPKEGARTCVNGSVINCKTQLRNGDRVLWGNNHFFRVNCPKASTPNGEMDTPARPIDYEFAWEELMNNELSNNPIQTAMKALEKQHEEDKQGALEKQRQMYERQLQMLRNQMSPSTPYAPYMAFDPFGFGKLTPSTPTVQSRVERWAQESQPSFPRDVDLQDCMQYVSLQLDELFKKSLAKLREDIVKANALVREANSLAEEMGKETEFGVTLQIPAANLTPNRKRSAFVSEPAILVKPKSKASQVWSMEKLENKLIDMRDLYNERKDQEVYNKDETSKTSTDPFYETQENHNLIGVANIFLEVLFHDVKLAYHVPIISQQGEVAGRLHVEISRIAGCIPDRVNDSGSESSNDSSKSSLGDASDDASNVGAQVTCRITIKQATGLPPYLSHFVFCQYNFWGYPDTIVVPPVVNTEYPSNFKGRDNMTIRFDNTQEFTVNVTEEFVEHCSDGGLSIEVWGHRSAGFGTTRPGWELDSQLLRSRSLADRWSELTRKIELHVEIHELNDQGEYTPVEAIVKPEFLTGGIYQLRQGQQRRILVRVRPVQNSGTLPIICEAITSIAVGGVVARNKLQKGLDSYQEEDLNLLREKWSDALARRREYLDEQIQKIIRKQDKTDHDVEREENLIDQWGRLYEEKNAVFVPAPNSGIPGEPAEWDPPAGMEKHIPVLFLDLNADDMSTSGSGDGIPIGGANSILPKEHGTKLFNMPIVKYCEKDVCAIAAWDSSIHDSIHLNRLTPTDERVYLILKAIVRLSHPATMEVVLRKRLGVNVYKRQTLTDRIKKKIVRQEAITSSAVTYELVSNIPKASEELEDREYLAQLAASGEDVSAADGESYIEKYTRGVSAVESILTLDRLRQQVAVKELLAAHGRPLRKTASVPNITHMLRTMDSPSRLEEQLRAESIGDISASVSEQLSRQRSNSLTGCKLQGSKDTKSPTNPFGLTQGSQPIKLVKPPMRTLLEEQCNRDVKPMLECQKNFDEEDDDEINAIDTVNDKLKCKIIESDEEYAEFDNYQENSKNKANENHSCAENAEMQLQTKPDMPSMSSSGYSSQAVSSITLSSDDSLSVRSISVDETPDSDVRLLKDIPIDRPPVSPRNPIPTEPIGSEHSETNNLLKAENLQQNDASDVFETSKAEDKEEEDDVEKANQSGETSVVSNEVWKTDNDDDGDLSATPKSSGTAVVVGSKRANEKVEITNSVQLTQPLLTFAEVPLRKRSLNGGEPRSKYASHRASYPAALRPENHLDQSTNDNAVNSKEFGMDASATASSEDDNLNHCDSPAFTSSQNSLHVPHDTDADDSTSQSSFGSRADLSRLSDVPLPEWLQLGESVLIRPYNYSGTVAFLGTTEFASGVWVGVALDAPTGKNDGTVQGVQYFSCLSRHGIFVRPEKLILDKRGRGIRGRHSAVYELKSRNSSFRENEGLSSSLTEMSDKGFLQRSRSRGDGLSCSKDFASSERLRRWKSRGDDMPSVVVEIPKRRHTTFHHGNKK